MCEKSPAYWRGLLVLFLTKMTYFYVLDYPWGDGFVFL
jgi:hypothetical protein